MGQGRLWAVNIVSAAVILTFVAVSAVAYMTGYREGARDMKAATMCVMASVAMDADQSAELLTERCAA